VETTNTESPSKITLLNPNSQHRLTAHYTAMDSTTAGSMRKRITIAKAAKTAPASSLATIYPHSHDHLWILIYGSIPIQLDPPRGRLVPFMNDRLLVFHTRNKPRVSLCKGFHHLLGRCNQSGRRGEVPIKVMPHITLVSIFCPPIMMWLLKSPLDQNLIVVYHKFNGNFKSHINFGGTKGGHKGDM